MNDNWWHERQNAYKKQQQRVMNEKFKKLWTNVLQSDEGKKVWDDPLYSDGVRDEIYREMFAKLILEEAMGIVRDEVSFFSDWACADNAVTKVKEHFGIE